MAVRAQKPQPRRRREIKYTGQYTYAGQFCLFYGITHRSPKKTIHAFSSCLTFDSTSRLTLSTRNLKSFPLHPGCCSYIMKKQTDPLFALTSETMIQVSFLVMNLEHLLSRAVFSWLISWWQGWLLAGKALLVT